MGFSYLFLGDARVPAARMADWLAAPAIAEQFDDWPGQWGLADDNEDAAASRFGVHDILAFIAGDDIAEFDVGADRVRLRAMVPKDGATWLTYRGVVAAAFRLAGRFDGGATLFAVTADDATRVAGFVVESAPGADRCVTLSTRGALDARSSDAGREVAALVARRTV